MKKRYLIFIVILLSFITFASNDNIIKPGSLSWKYEIGKYVGSSPAIGTGGTIYVGSYDSCLYALNPDGTLKWKYETGNGIVSSPAIRKDGTVYIGSTDGFLYAIQNQSRGLADSPWPKSHKDISNTGNSSSKN